MRNRLLLGHRGARALASIPENTFASFDRALDDGCDGFEFDVRRTTDNHPVICHDPQLGGRVIAECTREQLLEPLVLEDVLARYADKAFLDIELKVPGLEESTTAALKLHPAIHGCVISSFLPEVIRQFRNHEKGIPIGYICDRRNQLDQWRELDADYIIPHRKLVTKELLSQLSAAGKRVLVWTVNQAAEMLRLAEWGVDGIISDDTRLLVRTLGNLF